ncbi:MAG: methylenetetrahydrofolate reductase [Intestinimonas sp.]
MRVLHPGGDIPLWWLPSAPRGSRTSWRSGGYPRDADFHFPEHYHYASELIGHIRSLEGGKELCIGAACYPEGHVECPHREDDIDFPEAEGGHGGGLPHHPDVL